MDHVLYHHGIKGMKWGVRHSRNGNRARTSTKKRYSKKKIVADRRRKIKTLMPLVYTAALATPYAVMASKHFILQHNNQKFDTSVIDKAGKTIAWLNQQDIKLDPSKLRLRL